MFTKTTEQNIILLGAIIGLVSLLIYTFVHTGALLARYVSPPGIGYICAFGIETIIAGISYRLAVLRKQQTGSRLLVFVLVAALIVSAFANVFEGHAARYHFDLNWGNIWQTDPLQAFVGLAATGLISLLVFAISEIIGNDANAIVKANERQQRKAEREAEQVREPLTEALTPEPDIPQTGRTDYGPMVFAYLDRKYPNGTMPAKIPVRPTAKKLGCSPATAKKHIENWREDKARRAYGTAAVSRTMKE